MSGFYSSGELLGVHEGYSAIAVVGCGGKTSFISSLACELQYKKVLISPTTKIKPLISEDIALCKTLQECYLHNPVNGVQCMGILNDNSGKLEALPRHFLEEISDRYDTVLMEADGSRGLPCKGWVLNEPVIPEFSTHTVGIVTLNAMGKPADEDRVFRLPQFLALTKMKKSETISLDTIRIMICDTEGMFKNSIGKGFLFINQVEKPSTATLAKKIISDIKKQYPNRFTGFAYGSAKKNRWKTV